MDIEERIENIKKELGGSLRKAVSEQKHLEVGTPERVYWHYGYIMGLKDASNLNKGE